MVYRAFIRRLTVDNSTPGNKPMPMVLEEFLGGRCYRDLGNDQGHLWGFEQVINPPTLMEIHRPLFMLFAVAGYGTEFRLRKRVLGAVEEDPRVAVIHGRVHLLTSVKELAES